jgi:hypothetical protein
VTTATSETAHLRLPPLHRRRRFASKKPAGLLNGVCNAMHCVCVRSETATTAQLLPQHSFSDYTAVGCAFNFSSSDGTSYSFSDLQPAHSPQPRFQVLSQRHAICASACRQQLQRGTATALSNQQHPSNMPQQFDIGELQQQQSIGCSACASVSAFNAPALQLQLLQ